MLTEIDANVGGDKVWEKMKEKKNEIEKKRKDNNFSAVFSFVSSIPFVIYNI